MIKLQNLLNEKSKGLWHNIHAKRKRGEAPAKPGDKDYPKTLDIDEDGYTMGIYICLGDKIRSLVKNLL